MIEQMGHISFAAEVANIIMYLATIFNLSLPRGFFVGSGIYNFIYILYTAVILVYRDNICKAYAFGIFFLGLLKDLIWSTNAVVCIIDSLICIILLILISRHEKNEVEQASN